MERKPPPPPPRRTIPPPPPLPSQGSFRTFQASGENIVHAFPPPPRRTPPDNTLVQAIHDAEAALHDHKCRYERRFYEESVTSTQGGDVLDLLEMAQRLENSSVVSAAETEEMQRGLDDELEEGNTYLSLSQRERQTMINCYGDDITETINDPNYANQTTNNSALEQQQFLYGKANSYGSSVPTELPQKHKMPKQSFLRSSSDGVSSKHRPPPPGRKSSYIPPPPLQPESKKRDTYANMIGMAERVSSNRSLAEPDILGTPHDEQYWRDVRGKPRSKTHMKGKGHSSKNRTDHDANQSIDEEDIRDKRFMASQHRKYEHERRTQQRLEEKIKDLNDVCHNLQASIDAYDSCGELSGAEASQISRHSRNSNASKSRRLMANKLRKLEHEKRKTIRLYQKKKDLNRSCQSLDGQQATHKLRSHSKRGKRISSSTSKKKSGILALLQGKKDRHTNGIHIFDHNLSIQTMFDSVSIGSIRSGRSRSSRKSGRSSGSRRTVESTRSKRSTKSLRSAAKSCKRNVTPPSFARRKSNPDFSAAHSVHSATSIPILSAAADIFQAQSIPGDISGEHFAHHEAMSCNSSLSFYSNDDLDSDDYDSDESEDYVRMASVAEAVEHLNSQNKIEKFVSKMKHFL